MREVRSRMCIFYHLYMLIYNGLIFFLNIQKNILNLLNLIIIPNPNNLSLTVISESNDKNLGFDSQTKLKQSTKRKKIKKKIQTIDYWQQSNHGIFTRDAAIQPWYLYTRRTMWKRFTYLSRRCMTSLTTRRPHTSLMIQTSPIRWGIWTRANSFSNKK
jgi:hypothetical protein